jgi:hypothetical protein
LKKLNIFYVTLSFCLFILGIDFKNGFRGTLGFRKDVSGDPQNIDENLGILYV